MTASNTPTDAGVAAAPTPLAPTDGAAVDPGSAVFQWRPVPGVRRYHLQVSDDDAFAACHVDAEIDDMANLTLLGVLPEDGAPRFWRIRAAGGAWSPPAAFTSAGGGVRAPRRKAPVTRHPLAAASRLRDAEDRDERPPYRTGTTSTASLVVAFALAAVSVTLFIAVLFVGLAIR